MEHYTINYYDGEEVDMPKLGDREFKSINEAAEHCQSLKVPLSVVYITQWDGGSFDDRGLQEIVGQCNLDEAFEEQYTELP